MPLRCLDSSGRSIHSFDLSKDQWEALGTENKKVRHLKMPCCSSAVVLKRSRLGTLFFAHKVRGPCTTAPETEAHLSLKKMVVDAARAQGWDAATEITGATPTGEQWIADVLAQKGKFKVAIEIQWSGQTNEKTLERQARYRRSNIRGLWLLRQPGFPVTHDLPAVCIGGGLKEGFLALLPSHSRMKAYDRDEVRFWHQAMPMPNFLEAVFDRRLRFGIPPDIDAKVSVQAAETKCWHDTCRANTRVITSIDVIFGPNRLRFSVSEFGAHPTLLKEVLARMPENSGVGQIKRRYRNPMPQSYISNGCVRCDRLMGDFYVGLLGSEAEELFSMEVKLSEAWKQAIESHDGYQEAWGIY